MLRKKHGLRKGAKYELDRHVQREQRAERLVYHGRDGHPVLEVEVDACRRSGCETYADVLRDIDRVGAVFEVVLDARVGEACGPDQVRQEVG
jgi:hypothetical protein